MVIEAWNTYSKRREYNNVSINVRAWCVIDVYSVYDDIDEVDTLLYIIPIILLDVLKVCSKSDSIDMSFLSVCAVSD